MMHRLVQEELRYYYKYKFLNRSENSSALSIFELMFKSLHTYLKIQKPIRPYFILQTWASHTTNLIQNYVKLAGEDFSLQMIDVLRELAHAFCNMGNLEEARIMIDRAMATHKKYPTDSPENKAHVLSMAGKVYRNLMKTEEALVYYQQASEIYITNNIQGIPHPAVIIYNELGKIYRDKREWTLAKEYHEKAQKINDSDPKKYCYSRAFTLNCLGEIEFNLNNPESALAFHQQAINIFKEENKLNEAVMAYSLLQRGKANEKLKNMREAEEDYQRAYDIFKKVNGEISSGALQAKIHLQTLKELLQKTSCSSGSSQDREDSTQLTSGFLTAHTDKSITNTAAGFTLRKST